MSKTTGLPPASAGDDRAASGDSLWAFGPDEAPVTVRNAELLLAHLPVFLTGWPCRRLGDAGRQAADIDLAERPGGGIAVTLRGPGGNETLFDDPFAAADGLANALIARFVASRSGTICFHAGSAQVAGGLVVLLGDSFAGKSSVALQMAASGYRLFGDDRLAVRLPGDRGAAGVCLGLTPKVRLPLPEDCGARFAEYVEAFTEMRNDSVAYLKLWEGEAAGFREEAPLVALAILERSDGAVCSLDPATRADIVKAMLVNCFAPHIEAQALVDALTGLASQAVAYRLRFSSSREAATALATALRSAPAHARNG